MSELPEDGPEIEEPPEPGGVHTVAGPAADRMLGGYLVDPEEEERDEEVPIAPPRVVSTLDRTPVIHGIRAVTSPETFARTWKPKHEPWVVPVVPEPLVPAVLLGPEDEEMLPPNARKLARAADVAGWGVLVSFALGVVIDAHGRPAVDRIMGEDQGLTPTGKPKTKKVGETVRPQQPTVQVRVYRSAAAVAAREPDCLLSAQWLGGDYTRGKWTAAGWDRGVIVHPWRLVDWSTLWATFQRLAAPEA